jgi:hypothetical protein
MPDGYLLGIAGLQVQIRAFGGSFASDVSWVAALGEDIPGYRRACF